MKWINLQWKFYNSGSLEQVIAHASHRRKRLKSPSMAFGSIRNPCLALKLATANAIQKERDIERYRRQLRLQEMLTHDEIDELVQFDMVIGPHTIEQQIRCYYLKIKNANHHRAAEMLRRAKDLLKEGDQDLYLVKDLCFLLHGYMGGTTLRYKNRSYAIQDRTFIEL